MRVHKRVPGPRVHLPAEGEGAARGGVRVLHAREGAGGEKGRGGGREGGRGVVGRWGGVSPVPTGRGRAEPSGAERGSAAGSWPPASPVLINHMLSAAL